MSTAPIRILLSADAYTELAETSDYGYPVLEHVKRLVEGKIIWAPAIDGAFVVTTRGGDLDLHIGQDVSIGYLSHTDTARSTLFAGDVYLPLPNLRICGRVRPALQAPRILRRRYLISLSQEPSIGSRPCDGQTGCAVKALVHSGGIPVRELVRSTR